MKAKELRDFSEADIQGRIAQWQEGVFRSRFKVESSEARDTSIVPKLRRDIARAYTILTEKRRAASAAPQDKTAKAAK